MRTVEPERVCCGLSGRRCSEDGEVMRESFGRRPPCFCDVPTSGWFSGVTTLSPFEVLAAGLDLLRHHGSKGRLLFCGLRMTSSVGSAVCEPKVWSIRTLPCALCTEPERVRPLASCAMKWFEWYRGQIINGTHQF